MAYDFSNVRVLIVEDMQPMLALTTSLMSLMGFKTVHGAKSAQEGIQLFMQHNHDIIVTDWLMEPMDGTDLIKVVRNDPLSPNKYVPIILMTGYSDQPRVEMARDMGVTEFLMKPYSARDLYARIVQIIEKPRQFVDATQFFGPDRRRRKAPTHLGEDRRGASDKNMSGWPDSDPDASNLLRDLQEETKKL